MLSQMLFSCTYGEKCVTRSWNFLYLNFQATCNVLAQWVKCRLLVVAHFLPQGNFQMLIGMLESDSNLVKKKKILHRPWIELTTSHVAARIITTNAKPLHHRWLSGPAEGKYVAQAVDSGQSMASSVK